MTAWPAFADLMTILAVVSLAIAAVVVRGGPGDEGAPRHQIAELRSQLADAHATITEQRDRIRELQLRLLTGGALPCLWEPGPPMAIVSLLRIVVASDAEYVLIRLWPPGRDADVAAIPGLADAVEQNRMSVGEFERYAGAIYQHGNRADTFEGPCRFFVELKQGGTEPLAFPAALGVVNQYLLISNAAEVNRILRGED